MPTTLRNCDVAAMIMNGCNCRKSFVSNLAFSHHPMSAEHSSLTRCCVSEASFTHSRPAVHNQRAHGLPLVSHRTRGQCLRSAGKSRPPCDDGSHAGIIAEITIQHDGSSRLYDFDGSDR